MSKTSIIIPAYNEPYLGKTVRNLLSKAEGDIEILVNIDGNAPKRLIKDARVKYFHHPKPIGMRGGANVGLKEASGKFVMKVDAHCAFAQGFDEVLKNNCQDNWLVVPRRYSLDDTGWKRNLKMPIKDYHFLSYPQKTPYGTGIFPIEWQQMTYNRINKKDCLIDDTMTMQGSCWFAQRSYFMTHVGFLDDNSNTYSSFADEPLEIGLKYWLGGGKVIVNKKTWYAHLNKRPHHYTKGMFSREYKVDRQTVQSHTWAAKHWINNHEPKMLHPFQWLVEKFWPVPGWPENRKLWTLPE